MRALLIGLSILSTAVAANPTIHFARTYSADESETYKFNLVSDALKLGIEDTIRLTVKNPGQGSVSPTISIESVEHRAVSGNAGTKPDTLTTTVLRHNMPKDLSMTGNNYIFLLNSLAGFTPDKDMDIGDSSVIEWANQKESIKIHGRVKVTGIREQAQTITAHIDATVSMGNQPLGKASFDSIYSMKSGALISSRGTFGIPKLSYVIIINPG